ncbi:MAG: hypothetical protein K9W42_01090 [Candidatus Heimdallarchaeota archaeon]|nr:hypothetical protein [Candidatus Heimdallarchaeota archaeon]
MTRSYLEEVIELIKERKKGANQLKVGEEIPSSVDSQQKEKIKAPQKIKGLARTVRTLQRKPKETISKFDKKTFDPGFMQRHTREITYRLVRKELQKVGLITDLLAEINAGKEATIYLAHLNGAPLIVKCFRHHLTCHNSARGNPQLRATAFAAKEYYKLLRAYRAGVSVPTPAKQINNIILMRFIGRDWKPAPQLRHAILGDPLAVLEELLEQIVILYTKAKLIHGDLSEYNILIDQHQHPYIIDFPQAIDLNGYQMQFTQKKERNQKVLQKDLKTIYHFFERKYRLTFDVNEVFHHIIGEKDYQERLELEEIKAERI